MKKKISQLVLLLITVFLAINCSSDDGPPLSDKKEISSFVFKAGNNGNLDQDVIGEIDFDNLTIYLTVPFGTNLGSLIPSFTISENANSQPKTGEAVNFNSTFSYVVTAENNTKTTYTVIVTVAPNPEAKIISFSFPAALNDNLNSDLLADIDQDNKIISMIAPENVDISDLQPKIEVSENATIAPDGNSKQDFREQVKYTVTSESGVVVDYLVNVTQNMIVEIISFTFEASDNSNLENDIIGTINSDTNEIRLLVPPNTELTSLTPTIIITENTTISPENKEAQNFSSNVVYSLSDEDGNIIDYTVRVDTEPSNEATLLSFDFSKEDNPNLEETINGVIDEEKKEVVLIVPFSTDLSNLKPSIVISEFATVDPSNQIATNFINPVEYTVTSESGNNSVLYLVKVEKTSPRTESDILEFVFKASENEGIVTDVFGDINQDTKEINFILLGVDITELKPSISISNGATVIPNSGIVQDFSNPLKYVVTAEDGSETEYTVHIDNEESDEAQLLAFDFNIEDNPNLEGTINGVIDEEKKEVVLTVPFSTDLSNLKPSIVISEFATVDPGNQIATSFINPVEYTVTSQSENNSVLYLVKVEKTSPRNESEILEFVFEASENEGIVTDVVGSIDQETKEINFSIPRPFNIAELKPRISISNGATVSPSTNIAQDFSNPVNYLVTAEDGSETEYTINVATMPSSESSIISFDFLVENNPQLSEDVIGEIEENNHINLLVPIGTNRRILVPTIKFSEHASISPDLNSNIDFSENQYYVVTAEDLSTTEYEVVVRIDFPDLLINNFSFTRNLNPQLNSNFYGNIDYNNLTITFSSKMPKGTDVTNLIPSIQTGTGTLDPSSGVGQDFTNPVTYTITSFDGGEQISYLVTVDVSTTSDRDILKEIYYQNDLGSKGYDWDVDNPNSNLSTWQGVTAEGETVKGLSFANGRGIDILPEEIGQLSELISLNLFGNEGLSSLPASIGNLTQLTALQLGGTSLDELPTEIGNLSNLVGLTLSNSNISILPESIRNLYSLRNLNASYTNLSTISLDGLVNLRELNLSYTQLTDFPLEIFNSRSVKKIDISGSSITELPEGNWSNLINLTQISFNITSISSIPVSIKEAINLQSIDAFGAAITSVPKELGELSSLSSLYLDQTKIVTLPAEIGNLTELDVLSLLSITTLESLPSEICNLRDTGTDIRLSDESLCPE